MRWLRALGIGVITALVGGALAIYFGDLGTRAQGVSDFEGGRGMLIAFVLLPAGLLCGFLAGVAWGRRAGQGAAPFFRDVGLAAATTTVLIAGAGGLAWATADHAPTVDGREIELEFEVKIPASSAVPADLKAGGFNANLSTTASDNRFADLKFDAVRTEDDARVLPGVAGLYSRSVERHLLVGNWPSQVFALKLPAAPTQADFAWSDWIAPFEIADGSPVPAGQAFAVRYRVRFAN
jgi:hypothetical protein